MLEKIVENYSLKKEYIASPLLPQGDSAAPKSLIFHILENNSDSISVLDIGFGVGRLGDVVKANPATSHWQVDGVDGFLPNCLNSDLVDKKTYRNIWHGLAQEMPSEIFGEYDIVCLLDVIEHLSAETAKWLLRTLLSSMGENSFLFISTPLWFYPQDQIQEGDLEEHLIGVPATSMLALIPKMYSISNPLVGGFVLGKKSLQYVDFFQPTMDKSFSFEKGMEILRAVGGHYKPGSFIKLW